MKGFIALLLWTLTGAGQTVAVRGNFPLEVGGANLPAQKIGPNDLIAVSVYDAPELTRTIRVSADGMIRLPMVRQRLKASGLLPPELEVAIADALREEQILVEPVVTVTMVEYHNRPINVAGAVRKPVRFRRWGRQPCWTRSPRPRVSRRMRGPRSW